MSTWIEYNFNDSHIQGEANRLGYTKPLHMTLVHFPRNIDEIAVTAVEGKLNQWIRHFPKQFLTYPAGEVTKFDNNAIVQPFHVPKRIQDQRLILLNQLFQERIIFSNNYDWNPHVTIGEMEKKPHSVFILDPIKIIGVTFHHSFGDPYRWWLKP